MPWASTAPMCEKSSGPSPSLSANSTSRSDRYARACLARPASPAAGVGEDPSHQRVPSIKERIVDRFPIFLGGTDRTVEVHQLALELEEDGIIAGRILFWHRVSSCGRPHA